MASGRERLARAHDAWFSKVLIGLIAWGALTFGAVYPWGFAPLLIAAGAFGAIALLAPGWASNVCPAPRTAATLLVTASAILLQVVPLAPGTLAWLSPGGDRFARQYDLGYAAQFNGTTTPGSRHSLSIDPGATWLALACFVVLGLIVVGVARAVTPTGLRALVPRLITLGVALALIGIVQAATSPKRIYGFWSSRDESSPFGPFVNHNHFAGWMLMVLPVALGWLSAIVARAMRGVKPGLRNRLLWFSSPDASQAIWTAFAIVLMSLALVMTTSRSAVGCLIVALVLVSACSTRQQTAGRGALLVAFAVLVVVLVCAWVGVDAIAARFDAVGDLQFRGRLPIWRDALRLIHGFPLTGTGLNTFGTAMLLYQSHSPHLHFDAAHNDYLQVAAEGGLLVGVPALLLIACFAGEVQGRFRARADSGTTYWIRVGAVAGIIAVALQEIVDFSLQIPGNALLFAVLCGIALLPPGAADSGRGRRGGSAAHHNGER